MNKIEKLFIRKAVSVLRKNAVRELSAMQERLEKSTDTETLNLLDSGITVNLKTLKKKLLSMARERIEKL